MSAPRKPKEERRVHKHVMLSPSDLNRLDDYINSRGIKSRSTAISLMINFGNLSDKMVRAVDKYRRDGFYQNFDDALEALLAKALNTPDDDIFD